ncbi:MAG: hypothetical protein R3D55_00880 [Chloroflexota bacterium]
MASPFAPDTIVHAAASAVWRQPTARASFYIHTTTAEVDKLVASLNRAKKVFRL